MYVIQQYNFAYWHIYINIQKNVQTCLDVAWTEMGLVGFFTYSVSSSFLTFYSTEMAKIEVKLNFFLCKGVPKGVKCAVQFPPSCHFITTKLASREQNLLSKWEKKTSDKTQILPWSSPPVSQFAAPAPLHISVGPFMLESFAETGDATMGRTHCDDAQ